MAVADEGQDDQGVVERSGKFPLRSVQMRFPFDDQNLKQTRIGFREVETKWQQSFAFLRRYTTAF